MGMTDWIRESVIIMAIGQNPQVYLHSVRTAPEPHILCQINHTRLHENNQSFSLSLFVFACLTSVFWHSLHVQEYRLTKLCISWNVAHPSSICRDICAEKWCHLWKKADGVIMYRNADENLFECRKGFSVTGREFVIVVFFLFHGLYDPWLAVIHILCCT